MDQTGTSAALDESLGTALPSPASDDPSAALVVSSEVLAESVSGIALASPAAATLGPSFALESSVSIVIGEPPYAGCPPRPPSSNIPLEPPYMGCNIG
jgi:hypothetical protein